MTLCKRLQAAALVLLALGGTGCLGGAVHRKKPFVPARCIREVRFDGARCAHVKGDLYRCSGVTLRAGCVVYLEEKKTP